MKTYSISILLLVFTISISPKAYPQNNLERMVADHYKRLQETKESNHDELKNSITARALAPVIQKLSRKYKKRMAKSMIEYFALNPSALLTFKNVSQRAETLSRNVCSPVSNKRHNDDEVDAIRHLIWSALLGYYLGKEKALIVTSLQEDVKKVKIAALKMDLFNNSLGIEYGSKLKATRYRRRGNHDISKMITEFALKTLNRGDALVIGNSKVQNSGCTRERYYPNY